MLFEITPNTKAIYSCDTGYYRSKILEAKEEVCSVRYPITLLDDSCLSHGSSLEGREKAVRKILRTKSKLPIPVNPDKGIYMLPTLSKRNRDCVWLSYYLIDNYYQVDDRTLVTFTDGTYIYVKVSEASLDLQFKRTSQVIAQLNRETIFNQLPLNKKLTKTT